MLNRYCVQIPGKCPTYLNNESMAAVEVYILAHYRIDKLPAGTVITYLPEFMIEVTAEDIANGKPCDFNGCAIALAIQRYFGVSWYDGGVGEKDVYIGTTQYMLDEVGIEFVEMYDHFNRANVQPCTIVLRQWTL